MVTYRKASAENISTNKENFGRIENASGKSFIQKLPDRKYKI